MTRPADEQADMTVVDEAIVSRTSIRGFLPHPVPRHLIEHLLQVAARAPSGSNIQPWRIHVVDGGALRALTRDLLASHNAFRPQTAEYDYYPTEWRSPWIERRRAAGWGLYQLAGVERGDREASHRQRARNFTFYGAPAGLICTIDRDLGRGSLLDTGMFLQNLMIAARGHGLHTCPQVSAVSYPDVVRDHLVIEDSQMLLCGMALGWADPDEPTNKLRTEREVLSTFVTFHSQPARPTIRSTP